MRQVVIVIAGLLAWQTASSADPLTLAAEAKLILGADQGVYIENAAGSSLLAQQAQKPVHPASVSKVPTTLALLRKLGPEYRFTTTFSAHGAPANGTLPGDLLVESNGPGGAVGDICEILTGGGGRKKAQVVGFRGGRLLLMPMEDCPLSALT